MLPVFPAIFDYIITFYVLHCTARQFHLLSYINTFFLKLFEVKEKESQASERTQQINAEGFAILFFHSDLAYKER